MSTDRLTFANFDMLGAQRSDIYDIGAGGPWPGVIRELAHVFGHDLTPEPDADNLGRLIEKVGPETELQQNVAYVQDILGSEPAAMALAREWVRRSGLLRQVRRSFMSPGIELPRRNGMAVIFGGSRPSMDACVQTLQKLREQGYSFGLNLFAGGNRPITVQENAEQFLHGKAEYDYLDMLSKTLGSTTMILAVDSSIGEAVTERVASSINLEMYVRRSTQQGSVVAISSAGAWVQRAGQLRRTMGRLFPQRNFDEQGGQLFVATDATELGVTGDEPLPPFMNPFRALGQIVRNAQELTYTVSS